MTASAYPLDNADEHADARMDVLARLYDEPSQRALLRTGITSGWQCLEVGGGGGSVARWMAARVGTAGDVLCTDLDTRIIERAAALPNLRTVRHDIVQDPLPAGAFDLAHARLVLIHVSDRELALQNMVAALKPGGWLVIEDFDTASMPPDTAINPAETPLLASNAVRTWLTRHGNKGYFGRTLHARFRALGLTHVFTDARVVMFDRNNGGADLMRVNFEQLRADILSAGLISEEQLRADLARLDTEGFAMPSPVMWSVSGRKR